MHSVTRVIPCIKYGVRFWLGVRLDRDGKVIEYTTRWSRGGINAWGKMYECSQDVSGNSVLP